MREDVYDRQSPSLLRKWASPVRVKALQLIAIFAALAASLGAWMWAARVKDKPSPALVQLATEPDRPQAGEEALLTIGMLDAAGKPVTELQRHHGHELHVVLVSEDMDVFGHVHPQDFGGTVSEGTSRVRFTFPQSGDYLLALDAMTGEGPYAEQLGLTVAGGDADGAAPDAASAPRLVVVKPGEADAYTDPIRFDRPQPADGYEITLTRPARINAGETVTLTWRLTKDGEPVTDLRPFLEAAMHLAVVRSDLGHFVHAHGIAKGIETGYDHAHGPAGAELASTEKDLRYFGPEIAAQLTFPEPGRYYLFGQSAHGDALLVSRISVDVGEAELTQ